jgi:hypothetical protein
MGRELIGDHLMLALRLAVSALSFGFLVWGAAATAATPFAMSSTHRQFCCTTPPATIGGAPLRPPAGEFSNAGTVSVTGPQLTTVIIPSKLIAEQTMFTLNPHPDPKVSYLTTSFSVYNAAATLAPGGSVGTFSFCPSAVGPGVGSCASPSLASPSPRNGRIYRKSLSAEKFGGTMQLLGFGVKGKLKRVRTIAAPTYSLAYFYATWSPIGNVMPFKASGKSKVYTNTIYASPGSKNGPFYGPISGQGAGPWGTGYLQLSITQNANPPTQTVAISGYDNRDAAGVGNVQLVSGALYNTFGKATGTTIRANVLTLTLPEPGTGLGVAVGALALALIGRTRARRQH